MRCAGRGPSGGWSVARRSLHPALQAAVDVMEQQRGSNIVEHMSRAELLAVADYDKQALFSWTLMNGSNLDPDPYARAHSAADRWAKAYGTIDCERALRAWANVYWGGHKALVGATVRGWRARVHAPMKPASMDWVQGGDHLVCPYAYSQHRGSSPGGGTWAAQYRKAWSYGEADARRHLRTLDAEGVAQLQASTPPDKKGRGSREG